MRITLISGEKVSLSFFAFAAAAQAHRELLSMGRAKFSCACGTPRSARQAGDPQI